MHAVRTFLQMMSYGQFLPNLNLFFPRSVSTGNILVGERIPESGLGGAAKTKEASATGRETSMSPGAGAVSKNLGCGALLGLQMVRKGVGKCVFGLIAVQGTNFVCFFIFLILLAKMSVRCNRI
jgi:hypothetical protein